MANTSTLAKPIINALGMDFPRGFFLMTKKAGEVVPQIRLLPTSYLDKEHDYAVVLGRKSVQFYIDGKEAGTDVARSTSTDAGVAAPDRTTAPSPMRRSAPGTTSRVSRFRCSDRCGSTAATGSRCPSRSGTTAGRRPT